MNADRETPKAPTPHGQGHAALAEAGPQLQGIIASAMDAIISLDARQRIVLFNAAAEQMFGLPAAEALGQPIDRLIPERFRPAHAAHVDRYGRTAQSTRHVGALGTICGLHANGEEFPIEASISQAEVAGEKLFTVILRDVSALKRAEREREAALEELARAKAQLEVSVRERTAELEGRIAELHAFSYSLSHDLRAPIRAVQSFTHLALEECRPRIDASTAALLERACKAAERMDRLIQDVLALNGLSLRPAALERVDLDRLAREIVLERSEMQPPNAEIRFESPLLPVFANVALLTQCLTNLLGNAVKFVAPGVKPQVRVWTEPICKVGSGARSEGPHPVTAPDADGRAPGSEVPSVRLWVQDNGLGIPLEAQAKIFGIFQRFHVSYEGTGIGLAIVRKAAERMGGQVGVESELGKGSRFWIELKADGGC
jgi:PAS domain S-box-containing protein